MKKKLSIIMPIYNEEKTLTKIVDRVQKVDVGLKKELVIVNDASRDGSKKIIEKLMKKYKNIIYFEHRKNMGKGAAIRTALEKFSGDYVVIQDGDLEYNPEDFKRLLKPILEEKVDVVYGSRILGNITGFDIASHYYGNLFLSFLTRVLYKRRVTDMETCYKMMNRKVAKSLKLRSNRFDIEPEITAKIIKKGYRLIEMPIDYKSRSFVEGKKIGWRDGVVALYTLFRYRFLD